MVFRLVVLPTLFAFSAVFAGALPAGFLIAGVGAFVAGFFPVSIIFFLQKVHNWNQKCKH
jgi:hypothetical protein